jgi:hypothetical protein
MRDDATYAFHSRQVYISEASKKHKCCMVGLATMKMPPGYTYDETTAGIFTVDMRIPTLQSDGSDGGDSTPDRGLEIETEGIADVIANWPQGP